jgi:hypothetical protein
MPQTERRKNITPMAKSQSRSCILAMLVESVRCALGMGSSFCGSGAAMDALRNAPAPGIYRSYSLQYPFWNSTQSHPLTAIFYTSLHTCSKDVTESLLELHPRVLLSFKNSRRSERTILSTCPLSSPKHWLISWHDARQRPWRQGGNVLLTIFSMIAAD